MEASAALSASAARRANYGTARAFVSDARLAATAANQLRLLTLRRVFGASPAEANALTFVLLVSAADGSLRVARRVTRAAIPSGADTAIGGFLAREAAFGVAGPAARSFPFAGSLLTAAMLAGVALPELRRALHGLRATEQRMRAAERRIRQNRIRAYNAVRGGSSG